MKVGVIGLGYVGLPLVVAFAEAGDEVVALDVDPLKVSSVAAGDSYIEDIASDRLRAVLPQDQSDISLCRPGQSRCGDHLRPDAADREPRA